MDCIICSLLRTVCVVSARPCRVLPSHLPVSAARWPAAVCASGRTSNTGTPRPWASGNTPPRPHQVLGLDAQRPHLAILCALLDVGHELLLLVLELDALAVQFTLCLLEGALVLAQTLCRRHALAKRPLDKLGQGQRPGAGREGGAGRRTFMVAAQAVWSGRGCSRGGQVKSSRVESRRQWVARDDVAERAWPCKHSASKQRAASTQVPTHPLTQRRGRGRVGGWTR
jgi:hypothetical protein